MFGADRTSFGGVDFSTVAKFAVGNLVKVSVKHNPCPRYHPRIWHW